MNPHPFGYITVILIQQLLMVGMLWAIAHLVERLRHERRHHSSVRPFSNDSTSDDLAALAVQLSKTGDREAEPVPRQTEVRDMQEERI